jgi:hypothetical protein
VNRHRRHAFKQTPWRAQVSVTSRTLLPLLVLLVVGGMYLAVNARLARTGREVLVLQNELAELDRQYAELESTYASLTTPDILWERALEIGYRPATKDDVIYLEVEGFVPDPPFVAPPPPSSSATHAAGLSPAYTETLGDWLNRWLSADGGA